MHGDAYLPFALFGMLYKSLFTGDIRVPLWSLS